MVKQNINNNWGMVGKTTRAADQGWKCGEKKNEKKKGLTNRTKINK